MSLAKRTSIMGVAVLALLLAGSVRPAFADATHIPHASSMQDDANPATQATFDENMQIMRGQMQRLRATRDPQKRERLLRQHMHTMQATMHMMNGPGGMHGRGAMGPGMMQGRGMAGSGGMRANGQMMQMMMNQMMQHQQAMRAMGCPR